jgi:hypothetical protein
VVAVSSSPIPAPPPDASATVRGLVSTGAQTFAGDKTFSGAISVGQNLRATGPNGVLSDSGLFQATGGNTPLKMYGNAADGGSAVNAWLDTAFAYSTAGAKLLSIRNNGSEKAYIDKDGKIVAGLCLFTTPNGGQLSVDDSTGSFVKYGLTNFVANGVVMQMSANGTTFSLNTSGVLAYSASSCILGGSSPNAAAILQTDSTSKGFLPPRLTTTQRNAISSPPAGLVIFNTTTTKLETFDGALWQAAW